MSAFRAIWLSKSPNPAPAGTNISPPASITKSPSTTVLANIACLPLLTVTVSPASITLGCVRIPELLSGFALNFSILPLAVAASFSEIISISHPLSKFYNFSLLYSLLKISTVNNSLSPPFIRTLSP